MYIKNLGFFFWCKVRYCSNFIDFYVTEANNHSPLPVSKYHFVQYALGVSNPGGNVIVRCTRKNVYLASCPYITEKVTMIQLSLEV